MANKPDDRQNAIDNLNDNLTETAEKVQRNQKFIFVVTAIGALVVLGVLVYIFAFREPKQQQGNYEIGQADLELAMGNDSVALAKYMDVAAKHSHDAGNRAALQAAIILYHNCKYDEALQYIKEFTTDSKLVGPAAFSLEGDCYVNLDQLDNAIKAYKEAIKKSDKNPAYTPWFMLKLARVYREQGDYKAELAVYQEIQQEYPLYGEQNNIDIQKYLDRAQLQAEAE